MYTAVYDVLSESKSHCCSSKSPEAAHLTVQVCIKFTMEFVIALWMNIQRHSTSYKAKIKGIWLISDIGNRDRLNNNFWLDLAKKASGDSFKLHRQILLLLELKSLAQLLPMHTWHWNKHNVFLYFAIYGFRNGKKLAISCSHASFRNFKLWGVTDNCDVPPSYTSILQILFKRQVQASTINPKPP